MSRSFILFPSFVEEKSKITVENLDGFLELAQEAGRSGHAVEAVVDGGVGVAGRGRRRQPPPPPRPGRPGPRRGGPRGRRPGALENNFQVLLLLINMMLEAEKQHLITL